MLINSVNFLYYIYAQVGNGNKIFCKFVAKFAKIVIVVYLKYDKYHFILKTLSNAKLTNIKYNYLKFRTTVVTLINIY